MNLKGSQDPSSDQVLSLWPYTMIANGSCSEMTMIYPQRTHESMHARIQPPPLILRRPGSPRAKTSSPRSRAVVDFQRGNWRRASSFATESSMSTCVLENDEGTETDAATTTMDVDKIPLEDASSSFRASSPTSTPTESLDLSVFDIAFNGSNTQRGSLSVNDDVLFQIFYFAQVLHKGTEARVYRGVIRKTGHAVALKYVSKARCQKARRKCDPLCEVKVLEALRGHPSIVECMLSFETPKMVVIVMPFYPRGSLFDLMDSFDDHFVPGYMVPDMFRQVAEGVAYMHKRGVLHRDIKCENILVAEDLTLRVSDFGLSTATIADEDGTYEDVVGSIPYLSPEMLLGKRTYGRPVDVWGLGVILYSLSVGEVPFQACYDSRVPFNQRFRVLRMCLHKAKKKSFKAGVSTDCQNVLFRCLEVDPYQRIAVPDILTHPFISHCEPFGRLCRDDHENEFPPGYNHLHM